MTIGAIFLPCRMIVCGVVVRADALARTRQTAMGGICIRNEPRQFSNVCQSAKALRSARRPRLLPLQSRERFCPTVPCAAACYPRGLTRFCDRALTDAMRSGVSATCMGQLVGNASAPFSDGSFRRCRNFSRAKTASER
ncbi:hypothetical protein C8Q70DRAFT_27554 [Cubamyces menziesii]|nr:hypothetical protein C8Q70DRAFT_27554 [Cubamyces menziesii]